MEHRHSLPGRSTRLVITLLTAGAALACAAQDGSAALSEESFALCADAGSCTVDAEPMLDAEPTPAAASDDGWLQRCSSDDECSIGECVCGLCTARCSTAAPACNGVPEQATCYGGKTLARAALCHATTEPGICLAPCTTNEDCGEGFVCALDACMPEPAER